MPEIIMVNNHLDDLISNLNPEKEHVLRILSSVRLKLDNIKRTIETINKRVSDKYFGSGKMLLVRIIKNKKK